MKQENDNTQFYSEIWEVVPCLRSAHMLWENNWVTEEGNTIIFP